REFLAGAAPGTWLLVGLFAAYRPSRPVEDEWAPGLLPGKYVRPDEGRGERVPAQAHELPVPHHDLQVPSPQLPGSAHPIWRTRHRVPLRTDRGPARAVAGARVHPGRCPFVLPFRPD